MESLGLLPGILSSAGDFFRQIKSNFFQIFVIFFPQIKSNFSKFLGWHIALLVAHSTLELAFVEYMCVNLLHLA